MAAGLFPDVAGAGFLVAVRFFARGLSVGLSEVTGAAVVGFLAMGQCNASGRMASMLMRIPDLQGFMSRDTQRIGSVFSGFYHVTNFRKSCRIRA